MELLIRFLLENFTLSFFVIGLIAAAVSLWRRPRPLTQALVIEELFSYFLFFSVASLSSTASCATSFSAK
jgi:multisubunit Na+/H+ antiporter MnhE subunit